VARESDAPRRRPDPLAELTETLVRLTTAVHDLRADTTAEHLELRARLHQLEHRLEQLEGRAQAPAPPERPRDEPLRREEEKAAKARARLAQELKASRETRPDDEPAPTDESP
jgi:hypothetical protein